MMRQVSSLSASHVPELDGTWGAGRLHDKQGCLKSIPPKVVVEAETC